MAVELRKGQKVCLEKSAATSGEILINLNWSQKKTGFFSKPVAPVDLDLGCLFELKDGRKGSIQAVGKHFGNFNQPPYIALDGDDRTGASLGGENMRINGAMISQIKRVLVYTYIYEGVANWREADGVVTVKCKGNSAQDIVVRMDEYGSNLRLCAIALLENQNDTFSVEKVVQFFKGQSDMDRAFGWGLQWVPGKKD